MELVHVKGNTYYIDAAEAIPVYIKENRDCILLDSGWDYERDDLERVIIESGLHLVGIIGTHLHTDHCGSHRYFQEKYHVPVAMPLGESTLGFNELTLKSYFYIFTIEEVRDIDALNVLKFMPDITIPPDASEFEMAGVRFGIIHTPGHSPDHISVVTPDDILYLGDALLSEDVVSISKVPYYASIGWALQSMEKLSALPYEALAAHKGCCPDLKGLADYNIQKMQEHIRMFRGFVTEKMTQEDILKKACMELKLLSKQGFKVKLYERDMRSYIEYLTEQGLIAETCENGRLYYLPV